MTYRLVISKPETRSRPVGELRNGDKILAKVVYGGPPEEDDYYVCDVMVEWPGRQAAPKYSFEHPIHGVVVLDSKTTVEALIEIKAEVTAPKKAHRFWFFSWGKQKT